MDEHNEKIQQISKEVKNFYMLEKKFKIYHGSTNSTRTQNFKKDELIDISKLNKILVVNPDKKFAIVEPNVPMDALVDECLKYGMIPPVIMEFPGITVGGGFQGGAGESSSFKWGLFHNIVDEIEIITGNGDVQLASLQKNSDLFHMSACSYGSIGIITKAKIKLISAKKYVNVKYTKVNSIDDWINITINQTQENYDFVDGIMFSENSGCVITGTLSDEKEMNISTFDKPKDDWFYVHVEKIIKKQNKYSESIPIKQFLFRYDRGGFWVGRYAFKRLKIPFNKSTRYIFDFLFSTRTLYRFLQSINVSQRFFVQDISIPSENSVKFANYMTDVIKVFPIWICPLKSTPDEPLSPANLKTNLVINFGIWGKVHKNIDEFIKLNKDVEAEIKKLGGRKVLYAHSYYTEEEFWKIYDKENYDKTRRKYNSELNFPDIYTKTKVNEKYAVKPIKGLWSVIRSPKKIPINN